MKVSNKKIFVTGGAGFIGSHLAKRLIREDYDVHVLIRPSSDLYRIKDILPAIKCHKGDLSDFRGLRNIIEGIKPSGVFHLAVSPIMSGAMAPAEEVIKSNFLGTVNLINVLERLDYDFFINTGSFLEYGLKDKPLKESDLCQPLELYSVTKLAGTLYAQLVAKTKNKPIITFRLFTPYGPYIQKGRFIYEVIVNALENKEIKLTQPNNVRDFIFVDDIVDLYLEAAEKAQKYKGEIFNAGNGQQKELKYVVDNVLEITGSKSKVSYGALSKVVYDSNMWQADMNKTFSKFLWRPKYDIKAGLKKTIEWFKEN